jgi:hypothetical protein
MNLGPFPTVRIALLKDPIFRANAAKNSMKPKLQRLRRWFSGVSVGVSHLESRGDKSWDSGFYD